ncbi:hypothetical protein CRG98_037013 [Punica granatum]|uniref:Uncharacterized protein n=1 Tax=Punica granatum TaxID=22663 RepID=A0A2I0IFY4_PUNGR|nr:hypothetical protein CRG98_037013 [Punica granatum]
MWLSVDYSDLAWVIRLIYAEKTDLRICEFRKIDWKMSSRPLGSPATFLGVRHLFPLTRDCRSVDATVYDSLDQRDK